MSSAAKDKPMSGQPKARVLTFPKTSADLLAQKTRRELIRLGSQRAMMGHIQGPLVAALPHLKLKQVRLDIILDQVQDLFVVYLYAKVPGFPLTVKGPCERSCLVAIADLLCHVTPAVPGEIRRLVGIHPPYIEPMEEFARPEGDPQP